MHAIDLNNPEEKQDHVEAPESELMRVRREKLDRLIAAGIDPYPVRAETTATIAEIVERYQNASAEDLEREGREVRVAGRTMTIRDHGKTAFIDLAERTARIQIYGRKDSLSTQDWLIYENLDLGDWLEVEGVVFRTKKGELSIKAKSLRFLAKAMRPLPEKWHGLTDVEQRYRQRYVDLIVNDDVKKTFETRAKIIRYIRNFFDNRSFIEVETPMMQVIAGGAAARPFITFHNALKLNLYMRVAPELYLKRLIVGGLPRVYEINRNFRNEGISMMHNPEFTMLEFYQAYADYRELMSETEELLSGLTKEVTGGSKAQWQEHEIDFTAPFQKFTMKEAILHFAPKEAKIQAADLDDRDRMIRIIRDLGHRHMPSADATDTPEPPKVQPLEQMNTGKLIAELFELVAEKHLIQPTFILDFPVEVSPLSKQRKDDDRFVERFELYIGGMEVANAFSELNDPAEQARRFEQQASERER